MTSRHMTLLTEKVHISRDNDTLMLQVAVFWSVSSHEPQSDSTLYSGGSTQLRFIGLQLNTSFPGLTESN